MKSGKIRVKKFFWKTLKAILWCYWIFFIICFVNGMILRNYFYPFKYKKEVIFYSEYYDLNPALVLSIINAESGFDSAAESSAGAIGLMQITPKTANYIAERTGAVNYDLTAPDTNIDFGCYYIKYLLNKFENVSTAIAAYNAGEGNVSLWLEDKSCSEDGTTLIRIPFNETKVYVKKIEESFIKYKKLYPLILDKY